MITYLVRRIATIVPTLVFASILIFGLQQAPLTPTLSPLAGRGSRDSGG